MVSSGHSSSLTVHLPRPSLMTEGSSQRASRPTGTELHSKSITSRGRGAWQCWATVSHPSMRPTSLWCQDPSKASRAEDNSPNCINVGQDQVWPDQVWPNPNLAKPLCCCCCCCCGCGGCCGCCCGCSCGCCCFVVAQTLNPEP